MKIATKTLTSLLIMTVLTLSSSQISYAANSSSSRRNEARIERMTRKHDRKLAVQSSVLGVPSDVLKTELKEKDFDRVLKKHGFKSRQAFHIAVMGKVKDELHKRGWSDDKIQHLLDKRMTRLENKI